LAEIDQGIKKLSVDLVEQGIKDFGAGVEEVATAFEGCGVDTIVADIKVIAQELQTGTSG